MLALVNSHGLTSAGDPSGSPADAALFRKLRDAGQLTVRVDFAYNIDPAEPLDKAEAELKALPKPGSDGDGMFRSDEIGETGLDGAELTAFLERRLSRESPATAGFRKSRPRSSRSSPRWSRNTATACARTRSATRAIDEALDAFEYANRQTPIAAGAG